MSFNICGTSIEDQIQMKLREIEEKEHVKILHAVESGSRAWGFASPDSDYDVRFIYVRPMEYYLGLQAKKDVIDWELNDVLDINGWDICKALQHFYKSNATLYEWANSPVVYYTTPEWERVRKTTERYFSCKPSMYHYYAMANKNYFQYLTEDMVKYKKYFYVLRPILACKWIEQRKCPPPVLFQRLADEVLEDSMKATVEALVKKKVQMTESEKGRRIDNLNKYILNNLAHFKKMLDEMADDRNKDWDVLNQLFLQLLEKRKYGKGIGDTVTVTVNRPLGSYHPEHRDMYYPVNYGYVEGIMALDGEEQDAYILGVDKAVEKFTGKIIAVIHRLDDSEEKWVVAPENADFTNKDIMEQVRFQEQYFKTEIRM